MILIMSLNSFDTTFFSFSWLPEHVTLLARFAGEASPVKSTVTKAVAEFRRTHADTWNLQKDQFTEEQLEVTLQKAFCFCCFQIILFENLTTVFIHHIINGCRSWLIHPPPPHTLLDQHYL